MFTVAQLCRVLSEPSPAVSPCDHFPGPFYARCEAAYDFLHVYTGMEGRRDVLEETRSRDPDSVSTGSDFDHSISSSLYVSFGGGMHGDREVEEVECEWICAYDISTQKGRSVTDLRSRLSSPQMYERRGTYDELHDSEYAIIPILVFIYSITGPHASSLNALTVAFHVSCATGCRDRTVAQQLVGKTEITGISGRQIANTGREFFQFYAKKADTA